MEWSNSTSIKELDVAAEKVKNNRAHEVHLSAAAVQVLRSVPPSGIGPVLQHEWAAGVRLLAG